MKIPFSKRSFEYDRLPIGSSDESPLNSPEVYEKRSRRCVVGRPSLWSLTLLILAISILGNVALVMRLDQMAFISMPGEEGGFGPENFYPKGRKVWNLFDPEWPYNETNSEISDQAWKGLMPKKGGYVAISDEDKERYGLMATEMRDGEWIYGVSVFHQIHCLQMLRNAHYKTLTHQDHHGGNHQEKESKGRIHHYDHCFDFLRHALMCNPDTTLEPVKQAANDRLADTGLGVMHECGNWQDVLWFAGEHVPKNYPV